MSQDSIQPDGPVPVPAQLANLLLREIRKGYFPLGSRLPAERNLAGRYGVSRGSVRESLVELINRGVLYRVENKGTFVSGSLGQSDTVSGNYKIGFVVSRSVLAFYRTRYDVILNTVEEFFRERGANVRYQPIGDDFFDPRDQAAIDALNGCIIAGPVKHQIVDRLVELGIPAVIVDRPIPATAKDTISVRVDYTGGTRRAVEYLKDLGHEQIGFVGFSDSQKYRSYWESLEAFELEYQPRDMVLLQLLDLPGGILAGYTAAQEIINRQPVLPTGLLATNDLVAVGMMEALGIAMLKVPGQISVISLDDLGCDTSPSLTKVSVDLTEVGRVAGQSLLGLIKQRAIKEDQITIPVELISRRSTGPAVKKVAVKL